MVNDIVKCEMNYKIIMLCLLHFDVFRLFSVTYVILIDWILVLFFWFSRFHYISILQNSIKFIE